MAQRPGSDCGHPLRADDHGVFVLLHPMMPSRMKGVPQGVKPKRVGLAETKALLNR